MKRRSLAIALILFAAFAAAAYAGRGYFRDLAYEAQKPELPPSVSFEDTQEPFAPEAPAPAPATPEPETPKPEPKPEPPAETPKPDGTLPASFNLAVPFTSQAPKANWDEVHEETCEEAAVYMVHAFYEGVPEGRINPDVADAALLAIVDWENATFGFYKDTTAAETGRIATEYYDHAKVVLLKDPTVEDIKREVAAGRPVIVPAAGRELGNPNFTAPGPIYHNLVVRGWTKNGQFITNDAGTRLGEGYVYEYDVVMGAMHDWNGGDVANGAKVVLVVYP